MDQRLTSLLFRRGASARGFALVLVLSCLVLLLVVAAGLLGLAGTERRATKLYSGTIESQRLVERVVDIVTSQIQAATTEGTATAPVSWTSQPGMVRTFSGSSASKIYKLYSWGELTRNATGFTSDAVPADWASKPATFTDLNAPVNGSYPILDPSAGVNGLAITSAPGATATQAAPMPVKWLYMLKDGSLVSPSDTGGVAGADRADREIVARVAFWTDDETCKVNINTAAEGLYWDTPQAEGGRERDIARFQPVRYEVQRFPGHPAGVCLSEVFPAAGFELAAYGTNATTTFDPKVSTAMSTSANLTAAIAPRVRFGGSLEAYAASADPSSVADPIVMGASTINGTRRITAPDTDRLYASVGELLFDPARGSQHGALNFSSANATAEIAKRSFFLTAHSVAPETTLFETPKISLWPIRASANLNAAPSLTNRCDAYDKMAAFSASLPKNAAGDRDRYFFQREDPMSNNEIAGIARNAELYTYLKNLTGKTAPGFPQSLESALGAANRNSLLVQAFDMIRGTVNLSEAGLIHLSPTAPVLQVRSFGYPGNIQSSSSNSDSVGHVQSTEHDGARGFAMTPRIVRAGIGLYCEKMELLDAGGALITGNATATQLRYTLSPAVLVEAYNPLNPWGPRKQYKISARINSISGFDITAAGNGTGSGNWTTGMDGRVATIGNGSQATSPSMDVGTGSTGFTSPHLFLVRVAGSNSTTKIEPGLWGSNFTMTFPAGPVGNATTFNATISAMGNATAWGHTLDIAAGDFSLSLLDQNGNAYSSATITFDERQGLMVPNFATIVTGPSSANLTTTTNPHTAEYSFNGRWKVAHTRQQGKWYANDGDIVIAKEIAPGGQFGGDWRLACLSSTLVDTDFDYPAGANATAMRQHAFARGEDSPASHPDGNTGRIFAGVDFPAYSTANSTQQAQNWNFFRNLPTGVNGIGGAGDFTFVRSGIGAILTSPQEGGVGDTVSRAGSNFRDASFVSDWQGSFPVSHAMELTFSPNRQVYSPIQLFGGLMRRAATLAPWETLLFSDNPSSNAHPGLAGKDHLFADLFWMPVVDPYPISETFSTAGKVNLNATLEPFGNFIRRETALRAALKAIGIPEIDGSLTQTVAASAIRSYTFVNPSNWPGGNYTSTSYKNTGWTRPLDLDQTLAGIRDYLTSNGVFRSATQVCEIPLVPNGTTVANYDTFWADAGRRHTPDNLREQPYAHAYARLTTRSNTFTIHHRVQVLKKVPGTPDAQWVENQDKVVSEHRGKTIVERHLDPNATYPDYATATNPDPMTRFYKWRTLSSARFSP